MRLRINGKDRDVPPAGSLDELLTHLAVHRMIVVEHNGTIVDRPDYTSTPVREGDVLEIVHMVGGGAG